MIETYPLQWPLGYKKTLPGRRIDSRFNQTSEKSQQFLRNELFRMGATALIVSSNVPARKDGFLYTDMSTSKIDEPGVAIYFKYKGKDISMCCDQYNRVWENVYALGKGIEALRAMERWGVSDFMERVFTGFAALPEQTSGTPWWDVLQCQQDSSEEVISSQYKSLAKVYHPDINNGDSSKFILLKEAYDQALKNK